MFASFSRRRSGGSEGREWVAKGAALLDVRSREEFAAGHLEHAIHIPVHELGARIAEVPRGRVVVYCRSGGRSAVAAQMLREAGRQVLDMGPMAAW